MHVLTDGAHLESGVKVLAYVVHPLTLPARFLLPELTIFLMAALEWSAAVEMSSRDPA